MFSRLAFCGHSCTRAGSAYWPWPTLASCDALSKSRAGRFSHHHQSLIVMYWVRSITTLTQPESIHISTPVSMLMRKGLAGIDSASVRRSVQTKSSVRGAFTN